jgi:hypothetical protein
LLMLVGLAMVLIRQRKKRQEQAARPELVFFEVIEMVEIRKSRKVPEFFVNLAIVAVIFVFIWVMKHS